MKKTKPKNKHKSPKMPIKVKLAKWMKKRAARTIRREKSQSGKARRKSKKKTSTQQQKYSTTVSFLQRKMRQRDQERMSANWHRK